MAECPVIRGRFDSSAKLSDINVQEENLLGLC